MPDFYLSYAKGQLYDREACLSLGAKIRDFLAHEVFKPQNISFRAELGSPGGNPRDGYQSGLTYTYRLAGQAKRLPALLEGYLGLLYSPTSFERLDQPQYEIREINLHAKAWPSYEALGQFSAFLSAQLAPYGFENLSWLRTEDLVLEVLQDLCPAFYKQLQTEYHHYLYWQLRSSEIYLDFSRAWFTDLDVLLNAVPEPERIQGLVLRHNRLTALPEALFRFKNLQNLDLRANLFREKAARLSELSQLKWVYWQDNHLLSYEL